MTHKNDYTIIAFYNGTQKKWAYVHTIVKFECFLTSKHPGWKYFNVYDRRTGVYLRRFYPNSNFPYYI